MNSTVEHLIAHNIKPSAQRIAIMKYLIDHPTHPTVERIYSDLLPDMPTLSRTTVYNTLKVLEEKNALITLSINNKNVRFDGNVIPHAHFMCRCCGDIKDMPLPDGVLNPLEKMKNFNVEVIKLYYKGVCEKCQHAEQLSKIN